MWQGTCERFAEVDCQPLTEWVLQIPFEDWPQQNPPGQELKPAMINESWQDLKDVSKELVEGLRGQLGNPRVDNRMLSVVMPGHDIWAHSDTHGEKWLYRVHVPLTTNENAIFIIDGGTYWLRVGSAYKVNISKRHYVVNKGQTPRIHFMFDCYEPC